MTQPLNFLSRQWDTSYCLFTSGRQYVFCDTRVQILVTIADSMDATPTQVVLASYMARGVAVIPKSTHTARLQENLAALTYVGDIDINKQGQLSTIAIDGMDAVTETSSAAKAHAESLVWVVAESELDSELDNENAKTHALDAVKIFC
ncbi:2,5-diketo-D-gluconate reductase B [Legionella sainthelensi]|nr:2,5-diketo-D-gluconate reductase B [Legionella sainthelensi]